MPPPRVIDRRITISVSVPESLVKQMREYAENSKDRINWSEIAEKGFRAFLAGGKQTEPQVKYGADCRP